MTRCYINVSWESCCYLIFRSSFRRREWNGIKRIILEYSSLPLFGSFNGLNGKSIISFRSLIGREWNGYEGILISLYSLKTSNFHSPPKLGGIGGNEIKFNEFFNKILKILLYIQLFILKWGLIVIFL